MILRFTLPIIMNMKAFTASMLVSPTTTEIAATVLTGKHLSRRVGRDPRSTSRRVAALGNGAEAFGLTHCHPAR